MDCFDDFETFCNNDNNVVNCNLTTFFKKTKSTKSPKPTNSTKTTKLTKSKPISQTKRTIKMIDTMNTTSDNSEHNSSEHNFTPNHTTHTNQPNQLKTQNIIDVGIIDENNESEPDNVNLTAKQLFAFNCYKNRKNIFISGPGGSGKSFLISKIYQNALKLNKKIQVCALTGCAAILLNTDAKTIHSWSGIGLGNLSIDETINKIRTSPFYRKSWINIKILIIDEVSMMSLKLFNMLDVIGRTIRQKPNLPFGGIQVIFCGDFFQLSPVGNIDDPDSLRFCFESENWDSTFAHQICLDMIFRQNDPIYLNILNEIRHGKLSAESKLILKNHVSKTIPDDCVVKPTKLFPLRSKVDNLNNNELEKLESDVVEYDIIECFDLPMNPKEKAIAKKNVSKDPDAEIKYLKNNLIADTKLRLKIGAQVMCIININDLGLCNGSCGVVTYIDPITKIPTIKFNNNVEHQMDYHVWRSENLPHVGIKQIPLILAWSISIHKSQGASLDIAEIDAGNNVFCAGQTYVALSRVKSLDGLYLKSFNVRKILVDQKVVDFYNLIDP